MNSDEHLCFIIVSLQFLYNLSFCKFYIRTRKLPIVYRISIVFICQWLTILTYRLTVPLASPGSWGKGRASSEGYRLCCSARSWEPEVSSSFCWLSQSVSLRNLRLATSLEFAYPTLWCPLFGPSSSTTQPIFASLAPPVGRKTALPDWLALDWLSSYHRT